MLNLVSTAPDYIIVSIDTVFDDLLLGDNWNIIYDVVSLNGSSMLNSKTDFTASTPIADIRMHHPFWSSASLANLPTGLKALALAKMAIADNKPFSCYEFCVGSNIFPNFVELAEDNDLISLVAPNLKLSLVGPDMKSYTVLLDGKVGTVLC